MAACIEATSQKVFIFMESSWHRSGETVKWQLQLFLQNFPSFAGKVLKFKRKNVHVIKSFSTSPLTNSFHGSTLYDRSRKKGVMRALKSCFSTYVKSLKWLLNVNGYNHKCLCMRKRNNKYIKNGDEKWVNNENHLRWREKFSLILVLEIIRARLRPHNYVFKKFIC